MYRIKPEELYILSFKKGREPRPKAETYFKAKNVELQRFQKIL